MNRKLSIAAILVGGLAMLGEFFKLQLPSLSWFFSAGSHWGWISTSVLIVAGIAGLLWLPAQIQWTPLTLQRFGRFRSLRRGWWSFLILIFLASLALLDQTLVGKRALYLSYEGKSYFPAFVKSIYSAKDFGLEGDQEADYRQLQKKLKDTPGKGWVLMPIVPWAPVLDSDTQQRVTLTEKDGLWYAPGQSEPYNGRAQRYYSDALDVKHSDFRLRKGVLDGEFLGYTKDGGLAVNAIYSEGKMQRERFTGEVPKADFESADVTIPQYTVYPPIPPLAEAKHYLGTDSKGWDILAHIYGGWQVNLKAIVLYLLLTYSAGIVVGSLMGYLGGIFDLFLQRIVEIIEQLPFLYIVMIVVSIVSVAEMSLTILLAIICLFSWTSLTYSLRALAYKEKERDYISAARLQGASTWRILGLYLLPNMLATIVTVIPFSVAAIISSLTALSFLGFGLPEAYASWGWLFNDGVNNMSSPWISLSMLVVMVTILLLVSFVGEALREAFDPKKFSTYR